MSNKCVVCGDSLAPVGFGLSKGKTYRLSILQDLTDPNNDYEAGQWDLICESCQGEAARRYLIVEGYAIDPKRKAEVRKAVKALEGYEGTIGEVREKRKQGEQL